MPESKGKRKSRTRSRSGLKTRDRSGNSSQGEAAANESKQRKTRNKKAKIDKKTVESERVNEQVASEERNDVAQIQFSEDEERFEMEVDGQNQDFRSDENITEHSESDGELVEETQSTNNNATGERRKFTPVKNRFCDGKEDETEYEHERSRSAQEVDEEEEDQFFEKWEKFLKRKGLKITEMSSDSEGEDAEVKN